MDNREELQRILEALLLASDQPLGLDRILTLFEEAQRPSKAELKAALEELKSALEGRAVELREVAGGWRIQTRQAYAGWVARLWEEKPPRYSRALLETLALIVYRQPISRAEIEEVRGVSLSQSILKTLMERNWVRVVGYREVPGRPALFGTTKEFLDDFNLRSLEELPALPEIRDLDALAAALERLQGPEATPTADAPAAEPPAAPGSEALH
ncbi:MAG TPA: SMC-Scp complex subunit ScpB [Nevskiales bacterium]|nr:SMC-Scp complex subunit ScpB [Nevskiales bacterium]